MRYIFLGLLLFVIVLFGILFINGLEWKEQKEAFKEKCEAIGGQMYIPKAREAWPEMLCLDKEIFLNVE